MLISFRVENFRSFADEQEFSLVASSDDTRKETLIDCDGYKLGRAAAVYGANASGKSNLLKAIETFRNFVTVYSATLNLGDLIPGMIPFRLDENLRDKPSSFAMSAFVNGTQYEYAFSATAQRVHSESLHVRNPGPDSRLALRFNREYDAKAETTKWTFRGMRAKDQELLRERTRDNGLLLARAADLNFEFVSELYLWLHFSLGVRDSSRPPSWERDVIAKTLRVNPSFQNRLLRFVRDADLGILDVSVVSSEGDYPAADGNGGLQESFAARSPLSQSEELSFRTIHAGGDGRPVEFSLEEDESNGTQRFFSLGALALDTLDRGRTLVVDELDCSLHPRLTRKLLEIFQNPIANPRGAQLVFATHDSSLMTTSLLRRDQIWLTEKRQNGATQLFSLYDIDEKPRKNEALERNYLLGRYGGVPSFGPVFEDLEVP